MSNLPTVTLGSLVERGVIDAVTGFPFGGHNQSGEGIPHIRPFNIGTDGLINLEQIKSIPAEAAEGKALITPRSVVFNNTNSLELVGKCALWTDNSQPAFSNHMTRIRALRSDCDPAFLSYALLHHWQVGRSRMLARAHVAQASIMGARFLEIELPWPELRDQRAIAEIVDAVGRSRQLHDLQAQAASGLKRAAMRELFTRGLRGEAQKETEIGLMPIGWNPTSFADVREWLQYGTSVRCHKEVGRYPVLRIPNIEPGRLNPGDLKYSDMADKEAERYLLKAGDLLFIRTNGVIERLGACAVYAGIPQGALFASYLIRARLLPNVEARFAALFLESEQGTQIVTSRATPAADGKYNLNTSAIDSFVLPLPPDLDEQREIVEILDAIDQKIDLHKRKKAVLEELFKSLLHKLMTGEIQVADLDLSALEAASEVRQ